VRRIALLTAGLAAFFAVGWLAASALGWLTPEWAGGWLGSMERPALAAAVFGLLAADLVLPVPSSVVLSIAGMKAGWPLAALAGAGGMLAGNLAGYWLCRLSGRKAFERFVTPAEAEKFGRWLDRYGPAALVVSRLVPVMAETLSCLAGAARMSFGRFLGALLAGTLPFALFFALLGERLGADAEQPWLVLILSLAIPAVGWLVFSVLTRRSEPQ